MKVSIFGLGYVGAVTAGCLTEQGHEVIGVDVQKQKVEDLNRGQAPIVEPGLDALLYQAAGKRLLRATCSNAEAIGESDVSLVCVGTPSKHNGEIDLSHVQQVTREIAAELHKSKKRHIVVFRSTMLPGSTEDLAQEWLPDLIESGAVEVLYFPEFMREGTAVADFRDPSLSLVGTRNGGPIGDGLRAVLGERIPVTDWKTAELTKYACNAFHAAKIAFANEIGRLAKTMEIDAQTVMRFVCQDTRLNISSYYLRPGNPFGGSCLPKDVRALGQFGRQHGLSLPMIENLLVTNQQHLQSLLSLIADRGHKEIVILGLSFKTDTDDLRESAMVEVAQNLLGHGYNVRIYDPQLNLGRLVGSNKRSIDVKMPHLATLLSDDIGSALGRRGLVLAAQKCVTVSELANHMTPEHHVIDINGWPELRKLRSTYEGFCW